MCVYIIHHTYIIHLYIYNTFIRQLKIDQMNPKLDYMYMGKCLIYTQGYSPKSLSYLTVTSKDSPVTINISSTGIQRNGAYFSFN